MGLRDQGVPSADFLTVRRPRSVIAPARFDFVLESYTLQVLPPAIRPSAIGKVTDLVREGGLLLVIARAREEHELEGQMPWPLTRREFEEYVGSRRCTEKFTLGREWTRINADNTVVFNPRLSAFIRGPDSFS